MNQKITARKKILKGIVMLLKWIGSQREYFASIFC